METLITGMQKAAEHAALLEERHGGIFLVVLTVQPDGITITTKAKYPRRRELRRKAVWASIRKNPEHDLIREIEFSVDEFLYGDQEIEAIT